MHKHTAFSLAARSGSFFAGHSRQPLVHAKGKRCRPERNAGVDQLLYGTSAGWSTHVVTGGDFLLCLRRTNTLAETLPLATSAFKGVGV